MRSIKKCFLAPVLALVCLCIISCSEEEDGLEAPGISKALAELRKSSISNVSYKLSFSIPEQKEEAIVAHAEIEFNYAATGKDLYFDFNADPNYIHQLSVNGTTIEPTVQNEHLIVSKEALKPHNIVSIDFTAGEQSLNRNPDYLYTLFVPERASTCFPLFDQPDLKATYQLTLTIPKGWKAVANGEVEQQSDDGEERVTYIFEPTKPISSYLFAFAAGKFQSVTRTIEGREITMYHRETDTVKVSENVEAIFNWHIKAYDWLEAYTGIKYPFDKIAFVAVPSFQYGGMEHPGAIFYKATSLFLDKSSTLNQELGRAQLIAHEVSHMWFGDLVTMKWFDDVWLKEVFANFMAAKIVEPEFPGINHDLRFLMAHYPGAYAVDRTLGTHAIAQKLKNLKNAGSLYGAIIYQKAPIVMRMLEENVGKENFKEGIREYLNKYKYDNATWSDLLTIIGDNSDYNTAQWNQKWVLSAGMPSVYTQYKTSQGKIKDFRLYSRIAEDRSVWPMQVTVALGTADSTFYSEAAIGHEVENFIGLPPPKHIFSNAGGMGYGYFVMGPDSREYYLKNITSFGGLERAALWINYYEILLREGIAPHRLMDELIKDLPSEKNNLIAEYMLNRIETIYWKLYDVEERIKLAPKLEGLLLNMAIATEDTQIKSSYFNTLRDIVITKNGVGFLSKVWDEHKAFEGLELSENDYTKLAEALALRVSNPENMLARQASRITNPDRKRGFEFVMPALSADQKVRDAFFESLKNPVNRENEAWVLEALGFLHHPLRANASIKYIEPSLALLEEIKKTGDIFFPQRWLSMTLGGHSTEEAEGIVRQFLYKHNKYPEDLKLKILQSADDLFRAVEIKKKYKEETNTNL